MGRKANSKSHSYDPTLRTSEIGAKLYQTWRRLRRFPHVEEWEYYPTFYEWAIQEYKIGAYLQPKDESKPWGPDNCVWGTPGEKKRSDIPDDFEEKWNTSVNRIRKYCGLPPLEGTDYGDV